MESKHDVKTHYDVTNHAFITQLSIYVPKIHTQVHVSNKNTKLYKAKKSTA